MTLSINPAIPETWPARPSRKARETMRRHRRSGSPQPAWGFACVAITLLFVCPLALASCKPRSSPDSYGHVIGVDIGNTYSSVSVYRDRMIDILPNEHGRSSVKAKSLVRPVIDGLAQGDFSRLAMSPLMETRSSSVCARSHEKECRG
jgi:hypothetical protein